jgi:1,4-dihydroxy-2-naphthoyl-CoA synthase
MLYKADGPVATITLNRPEHLNTIVPPMPDEIEAAIGLAERDPAVKVSCCVVPVARSPAGTTSAAASTTGATR